MFDTWTTSELSASTPISGRLQPRTRGNGTRRRNKERNVSWRNGSLQKKSGLDTTACGSICPNVTGRAKDRRIAQTSRLSLSGVAFVLFCSVFVFLLSLKPRPFTSFHCFLKKNQSTPIDLLSIPRLWGEKCQNVFLRYACAPTATRSYLTTVCCAFFRFFSFFSLFFCSVEMSLFPSTLVPLPFFPVYGEYVVRFSLADGVLFLFLF